MANYVVAIIADEDGFTVVPGQLLANNEDKVYFQNLTTEPVTLKFNDENLFGYREVNLGTDQDGEPPKDRGLTVNKVTCGSYGYTVTIDIQGKMVYAHASRPKIIIYRSLV